MNNIYFITQTVMPMWLWSLAVVWGLAVLGMQFWEYGEESEL